MIGRVLPTEVLRALRELRITASPTGELTELAWASAVAVRDGDWSSTMERTAAQGFCHALRRGDLERAARCGEWIYAPGAAFRRAQAELNARTQGAAA